MIDAKQAAAVIPRLDDGRVLVGDRTTSARSFPGYLAFPGGGLEPTDHALPRIVTGAPEGELRACALRELGEETGRWLLATTSGARPAPEHARRFTDAIVRGAPLASVLAETGLALDDRHLIPLGRWVTSDVRPARFAVRQFLLPVPDEAFFVRTAANDELERVAWVEPAALRAGWAAGDRLLLPPIRHVVRTLVEAPGALDALVEALRRVRPPDEPEARDIVEGIAVQPHRTPTLPPATTTNTVLVGADDYFIVDPATPYDDERLRFDALVAVLAARHRRPLGILLTHHHRDHTGDVERLRTKLGIPVFAHPETAKLVPFPVDRALVDGDELTVPGRPTRRLRVLHTPGHARGHLCFFDDDTGVLIAGDMVAAEGSILIDPDEGHMGTFLASLERLLALPVRRVVPAHGPLLWGGRAKLEEHLAHRRVRQSQVLTTLGLHGGGATPADLVPAIYGGTTPEELLPLAARSVLAALTLLVEEGRARHEGGRYFAA